jgi:hypothetical protein
MNDSTNSLILERHTQIAYHSPVENKDAPIGACVNKFDQGGVVASYDAERGMAVDEGGVEFLAEMRNHENSNLIARAI